MTKQKQPVRIDRAEIAVGDVIRISHQRHDGPGRYAGRTIRVELLQGEDLVKGPRVKWNAEAGAFGPFCLAGYHRVGRETIIERYEQEGAAQ